MSPRVTSEITIDDWRSFVELQATGNVFQTPEIEEVFRRTRLHKPLLFATFSGKSEISSLILAVHVKTIGWLPSRPVSRCIAYGGILAKPDGQSGDVSSLLKCVDSAVQASSLITEIRNITDTANFKDEVTYCGYHYFDYLNYLIPLDRQPDEIFQGFSRSRRQNIRKLENERLFIQECHEREDILRIYQILRQTYARISVPLADISLFQAAFDIMKGLGMAKFFLAKAGEEDSAAGVALFYKKTIYLWYLGTKTEFLRINPASLIVWHLAKWGSQNGYEKLDFLGAGRPEKPYGVREFKKRFGGNEVNYGRYQKVYSPLLQRTSEKLYSLNRKFL